MSYLEIVQKALKGRSVNETAKAWGIGQVTLNNYAKGKRVPDFTTTQMIMKEAGVSAEELINACAEFEKLRRQKDKINNSFNWLLRMRNALKSKDYKAV